jgi:hypothetical protein
MIGAELDQARVGPPLSGARRTQTRPDSGSRPFPKEIAFHRLVDIAAALGHRTRLSGTQARRRARAFRAVWLARSRSPRHPCASQPTDCSPASGRRFPLGTLFCYAAPGTCYARRLPTQGIHHYGPSVISKRDRKDAPTSDRRARQIPATMSMLKLGHRKTDAARLNRPAGARTEAWQLGDTRRNSPLLVAIR